MALKYHEHTANHRAEIRYFLENEGSYGFACAYKFVLATIRNHFSTVHKTLNEWSKYEQEVAEAGGDTSKVALPGSAWGMKGDGLVWLLETDEEEVASYAASFVASNDVVDAMDLALTLPGLGMVKAGFLCQLYGHPVGCIDSHNADVFNVSVDRFRVVKTHLASTRIRKIHEYIDLCGHLGGADYLWDHWCAYLSSLYRSVGGPASVSGDHVNLVCR